jgi:enolase
MFEKRQQIPLKEKQKYILLIQQGANHAAINFHYQKKYGLDLARSTFYKWKAESSKIMETSTKTEYRQKKKQSKTILEFEKKLQSEYQKRKTKLKARGMSKFIISVRDEFFKDNDELKALKFTQRYVLRLVRDLGRRSSKTTDTILLTEEGEQIELHRLRSYRDKFGIE